LLHSISQQLVGTQQLAADLLSLHGVKLALLHNMPVCNILKHIKGQCLLQV